VLIIGPEGQRDALLLPHMQKNDVNTCQHMWCQGAGGSPCPQHMLLVGFWRLWLPACDNFDHQVIPVQRKGRLRRVPHEWRPHGRDGLRCTPPPRSPQKRSARSVPLAVTKSPSAVTTCADSRLSATKPYLPIKGP